DCCTQIFKWLHDWPNALGCWPTERLNASCSSRRIAIPGKRGLSMKKTVISIALVGCFFATSVQAQTFLGFRLLDLNGHNVRWPSDSDGNVNVTYAFVTKPFTSAGARNCADMVPLSGLFAKSKVSPAEFQSEVREAFDMWEKVANIKFREIEEFRSAG